MAIKLAVVCHRYPFIGGIQKVIQNISKRLVHQGFEIEILTVDPSGGLPREEQRDGLTIRRFESRAPGDTYYSSPNLRKYLGQNNHKYDIVHAHNYMALPAFYAIQAKNGNKLVFSPHYHKSSQRYLSKLLRIPYHYMWARVLHNVDKVIFVSEAERHLFLNNFSFPDDKCAVTYNGISPDDIEAAQSYPVDQKVILFVGRLVYYKNIHWIIKAMPYLDEQYILVIVGDGPYKNKLLELIDKLKLRRRVKILSDLGDREVVQWYKTCSVFVCLSSLEAFGISVLEALAAGKPAVVSDIPAFLELAAKFKGIQIVSISGGTPQALANRIVESARLAPQTNDLSEYSWDKITEKVKRIYVDVLEGKSPS
jgi:glycosyltransferase involved in cell wall biosynthesis